MYCSHKGDRLANKSPHQKFGYFLFMSKQAELEFLKRIWGLGTEEEEGYRTGPPGYIGWRN
jgi:hypothetical protein